jgi:hypothetical protein
VGNRDIRYLSTEVDMIPRLVSHSNLARELPALRSDHAQRGMLIVGKSVSVLARSSHQRGMRSILSHPGSLPTCSFPLNTYNLKFWVGFLASGGSLYFSNTPVTSAFPAAAALAGSTLTVLVSAAKRPEGAKLGLGGSRFGGGEAYQGGMHDVSLGLQTLRAL